ncbi:twin-arginine translocase TatA/TatE family subunit [Streptomyces rubiginosohelvolus]|uniref:Twin-arginine translocase TatA/TatE family subunit n=1 Tax=Streptomyces rubiginosohelvolus TaxID=67362 RepID=A0ABW6F9G5_9ACTN|nr:MULTISPECIES: twin-arginine translocase TatA/TatE family subunit [unclassified Streptomyces]MZG03089.1 Sec-independent protein translocase TatA [Streptomyces sp. SID5614]
MFGIGELTLLLLVIVAVLAVKRLPELMRSAGKAARILKSEKRALKDEDGRAPGADRPPASPQVIRGEATERDAP